MKNWFERFFSVDEFRVSGMVIALFVVLILDIYSFFRTGDVSPNLLILNGYLIGGISGVNLIGMAINSYANRNTSMYDSSGLYGSNYGLNNIGMTSQPMNMNSSTMGANGIQNNNLNQSHNLNDPPVQKMPIVSNSGVKSPI